jgi:hypothetical protein
MANINNKIRLGVEKIARSLTRNNPDFEDANSEGLVRILEMEDGHKDSYYIQAARFRIRDFLKRERLHQSREFGILKDDLENIPNKPLEFGKATKVPDYDNIEDDEFPEVDRNMERWLKGKEI